MLPQDRSLAGLNQSPKLKSSVPCHRHATTSLPAACKPLPADQPRQQDPHHWRGGQLDAAQHLGRRLPAGGLGWLAYGGTAGCRRLARAAAEQRALHEPVIMSTSVSMLPPLMCSLPCPGSASQSTRSVRSGRRCMGLHLPAEHAWTAGRAPVANWFTCGARVRADFVAEPATCRWRLHARRKHGDERLQLRARAAFAGKQQCRRIGCAWGSTLLCIHRATSFAARCATGQVSSGRLSRLHVCCLVCTCAPRLNVWTPHPQAINWVLTAIKYAKLFNVKVESTPIDSRCAMLAGCWGPA